MKFPGIHFLRSLVFVFATTAAVSVSAAPVLMISIDGLRPADVLAADTRGLKVPNLRAVVEGGAYASEVRGVLPTVTYPSHTTLLTGVAPAQHGVVSNLTFDPLLKNQQGWYWYAEDIRVPTLWDAAHAARLTTANVHWPVSVGAQVDYNLPQIWRTGTPDDRKFVRAVSTPGLLEALEHDLGAYADGIDESIEGDENRGRFSVRIIENFHPKFMTAYFTALDHTQHGYGPDTPEARAVLERIDTIVGNLITASRKSDANAVVAIVSDHGFAPLAHDVNLMDIFIKENLVRLDEKDKVTSWDAEPWYSGGSAAIVLRDERDAALRERVKALLDKLAKDESYGIARVLTHAEVVKRNGNPAAQWYVEFKPGYQMAPELKEPRVGPSKMLGMHGYDADLPEMRSTFLLIGPGIPAGKSFGDIDMRDITPTLAHILGVPLPESQGKPLL
jgi:predicted AlkP superfamily pyrophosphatase or phosphodiesterase